ncbi:lactate 2-monooxygenase [Marinobacter halotolerans]|uniref:lactate 2-monooxygenase n=1 Tax=Marinobacter halotolerans TaxID=1569211 RepID=UPI0012474862|nr:lactate 2-monooxygenase [Marinobacter halotolerans]
MDNNPAARRAPTINRQQDIYSKGLGGEKPRVPVDFHELERQGCAAMSEEAYAYIAGGAGLESTMRANRESFDRQRIVPRMLKDVSERDTTVNLFGRTLPSPFLLSPIGVLEMAHRDADAAVGRAAAAEGIPMIFSNQASQPMEKVADTMGDGARWFQLYWSKSDDLVRSLVSRAEACGCEAIVVTLDTTMLGWRTRDLDLAYLPFLRGKGIAQYTSDPVFLESLKNPSQQGGTARPKLTLETLKALKQIGQSWPGGTLDGISSGKAMAAVQEFISVYSKPSLTWDDLKMLRDHTSLPIVLKGIQHPDDGRKAVDYGMDGIIVSNHGGRQVDGAIGSLEALPAVVEAVAGRMPVIMDSGIRTGADVFKALALGATAVCLGRPWVYGLAIAGEAGVREVIANLKTDFELTMGLSGCKSISEITPEALR